ncbi:caspase family protein [Aestuariivita sp.]|jgi:hypothetical protein|uniref:caspase family protein n=1 Tax=Aestuariivita sp. TaxID=1872407 RepID=UPI00216C1D65|nr:caspase family protein [Aestuariivita sp.]MCE8007508.1 hypothetical protein [Aestuariivita sp.]
MAHHQPNDYALVIGVNDYPNHGSKGKNLKGAVPDAKRFAAWLTNTQVGGGLPPANCHLITSTTAPLSPVKDTVDSALEKIWDAAEEAGGGRRFYLFFAGHGQSITIGDVSDTDVALCLPQWSRRRLFDTLSSDNYCRTVKRCMPFQQVVAFLDCCRSRTVRAATQNSGLGCLTPSDIAEDVKGVIVYAAEDESQAFETATGRGDEDEEQSEARGYFTTALLSALNGAAARDTGGAEWESLWDHLQAEVPRLAQKAGKTQSPRIKDFGLPNDAVFGAAMPVAGGAGASPNFTVHFSADRTGPVILLNDRAEPVRSGDPASGPWHVRLSYALHTLVDTGTGGVLPIMFAPEMEGGDVTF